ncbi:hypothetical protein [Stackebrandtia soli]|uniref:hypothetical protein n=1 Tax=Stackebrandtia soli TaxID=1892856 RepID=UPI0039E9185C
MVEVVLDVNGDDDARDELFAWVQRIPLVAELNLRRDGDTIEATLNTPAQLGTLAMAVATFLRMKPSSRRPAVTIQAPNGEYLDVQATPDPNAVRRVFIAMDKAIAPIIPAVLEPEVVDAEIIEDPVPPTTRRP